MKIQKQTKKQTTGVISITSRGTGYVASSLFEEDIEIPAHSLNTALNGDTVDVVLRAKVPGRRQQGSVERILERAKTKFVGTLEVDGTNCFLVPDDRRMYTDIFIRDAMSAHAGEKALVEIVHWDNPKKNPEGKILSVLGARGTHDVEMRSIALERGFESAFPAEVDREANAIKKVISPEEITKRKDMRTVTTFTIDPEDAKDFDDAISFRTLPDGTYEVGIHIADVSHYVRPGSELDREALSRGTSVYLVDRTIPMLPEVLSNDICSLKPNEDRLAFSALFTLTQDAMVTGEWFGETVIHSDKRFTYEEAQRVLDGAKGPYGEELALLNTLAKKLRRKRVQEGAIEFDRDEVKFVLDEAGVPIAVKKKQRTDTNLLIEDFMLLANSRVAEFIHILGKRTGRKNLSFIYRVHDTPKEEKIEELAVFLKAIGYDLEVHNGKITSQGIGALLREVEGTPEENLIKTATIRSMAKAVYSTKNIGHFGLAFQYYTHFTSPIRRYPDILAHRILKDYLAGVKIPNEQLARFEKISIQSSQREVSAVEAERDSIKYKQVEYMKNHVGEEFDGTVTGVTEWGLYVEETETQAEGLVRVRDLKDDFYTFEGDKYRLIGTKSRKVYSLGDPVRVKLIAADLEQKTLDFALVSKK